MPLRPPLPTLVAIFSEFEAAHLLLEPVDRPLHLGVGAPKPDGVVLECPCRNAAEPGSYAILIDSEAEYIFVLDKFYNELQPCIPDSKLKKIIVCKITDLLSPFMRVVIPLVMLYKKQSVNIKKQNNIVFFKDIVSNNFSFEDVLIDENDIALLQYTGGTTGKSKAAILTHKNLLSNVQQVSNWIEPHIKQGQEIVITALPLFIFFHSQSTVSHFLSLAQRMF